MLSDNRVVSFQLLNGKTYSVTLPSRMCKTPIKLVLSELRLEINGEWFYELTTPTEWDGTSRIVMTTAGIGTPVDTTLIRAKDVYQINFAWMPMFP